MFSRTTDYALRALLVLARAHGHGPLHADAIAEATGSPRNYLSKVLNALAKEGVVRSARGPAGGFTLARAPASITVAELVDVFEHEHEHERCILGTAPCNATRPCAAHHRWSAVRAAQRAPLEATSLSDLLGGTAPPAASPDTLRDHATSSSHAGSIP